MSSIGRDADLLPAIFFGVLVGALATSLIRAPQLPVNGILAALAALLVGWWINIALKRRAELDRVPIDYIEALSRRIDEMTFRCLESVRTSDRQVLLEKHLTPLANEIYWLNDFAMRIDPKSMHGLTQALADRYVDMKEHLTGTEGVEQIDLRSASRTSRGVRVAALAIRWHACRQILDRQPDLTILASIDPPDDITGKT